jgi:hypothetical protein
MDAIIDATAIANNTIVIIGVLQASTNKGLQIRVS